MVERNIKSGEFLITPTDCRNAFTPEDFTAGQRIFAEATEKFIQDEILPHIGDIENQEFAQQQYFDLILTGMQSQDCGSAQVGVLLAEMLAVAGLKQLVPLLTAKLQAS